MKVISIINIINIINAECFGGVDKDKRYKDEMINIEKEHDERPER